MSRTLPFVKMHGTGNDFVLIDARHRKEDWSELAARMCDRHFGIGADGLLLLLSSKVVDYRMRIINADGSEAEMCGNGIRCFTKYVLEEVEAGSRRRTLSVETLSGVRNVVATRVDGKVESVRVAMGAPRLAPTEVPVDTKALRGSMTMVKDYPVQVDGHRIEVTGVSMGNPHAVHFIDMPVKDFPLHDLGPKMEHHPFFPKRVNFEIVHLTGKGKAEARVWERGVGETLACGSGASAIMAAARLHGLAKDALDVALPGGPLHLEWDGEGEVYLTGPAKLVFRGEWVA